MEFLLIIHHYPTFSGWLVLQVGAARRQQQAPLPGAERPSHAESRSCITAQRAGKAHEQPPRFLYEHLAFLFLGEAHVAGVPRRASLDSWSAVGGSTTLPACPLPAYLLSDKLLPYN